MFECGHWVRQMGPRLERTFQNPTIKLRKSPDVTLERRLKAAGSLFYSSGPFRPSNSPSFMPYPRVEKAAKAWSGRESITLAYYSLSVLFLHKLCL